MISLGLAFAFVGEVCLYLLVCLWAWDRSILGLPLGMIVVLVVSTFIALRVAMVLFEFLLAYLWRSPRDAEARIGLLGTARLVVSELFAFLFLFCLLLPLSRRLVALRRSSVTATRQRPVLLIHGYGCNAGVWAPMIGYLWRRGLANLFTMNLHPKYGDIDDFAQQLAARVNRICESTRADKVVLVGHNMGGLVARAYVERCGGASRVAKVISIGTPHHGTVLARLVVGTNASQMRVGNTWLQDLNRDENQPTDIEHISIYSVHDNLVMPQSSAEFGKAKNIPLVGAGHFMMVFSKKVGQLVYREVAAA